VNDTLPDYEVWDGGNMDISRSQVSEEKGNPGLTFEMGTPGPYPKIILIAFLSCIHNQPSKVWLVYFLQPWFSSCFAQLSTFQL
jgi:hypothetical protein